jgi:uncharacterized protein (TIGR03089 family)
VELSGATTANWVAKTANLLVDGHGGPARVGLLLPLHWQLVCFLLGAAAAGSEVVVAAQAADLAGCAVAFVRVEDAEAALDAGVEDVLAVSGHPLGARLAAVPPLVLDAAVEVPGYGDRFPGPHPAGATVLLHGEPFVTPDLGLGPADRVLTTLAPATEKGLGVLLAALRAGASLVLLTGDADAAGIAAAEQVTAAAGAALPGLRAL